MTNPMNAIRKGLTILAILCVAASGLTACGGGGNGGGGNGGGGCTGSDCVGIIPNGAPTTRGSIPDQTLEVSRSKMIDLSLYFTDPDGDTLTYRSMVNDDQAGNVRASVSGNELRIEGVAPPGATVRVTASDPGGLSASGNFDVSVRGNNSCRYAGDGECDEPGLCRAGTDTNDCRADNGGNDPVVIHCTQDLLIGRSCNTYTYRGALARGHDGSCPIGQKVAQCPGGADGTCSAIPLTDGSTLDQRYYDFGNYLSTGERSCRDQRGTWSGTPPPPDNRAPTTRGSIPDQTLEVGRSKMIDLSLYFTDPDGDTLTYQLRFDSGQRNNVRASVSGNDLWIEGVAPPGAYVGVIASDPRGRWAHQNIRVVVSGGNFDPVARGSIPDQTLEVGRSKTIDLSPYFTDPDGDTLTYQLRFSRGQRDNVRASVSGNDLWIEGVAEPGAGIRVTASDPGGRTAYQDFTVTVRSQRFVSAALGTTDSTWFWSTGRGDSASAARRDALNRCAEGLSASCSKSLPGTTGCVSVAQSEADERGRRVFGLAGGPTSTASQNAAIAVCRRIARTTEQGRTCAVVADENDGSISTNCGSDGR